MGRSHRRAGQCPPHQRTDGAAVDAEGNEYAAKFKGRRVCKFPPDGRLLAEIHTPEQCSLCLAFFWEPEDPVCHHGLPWPQRSRAGDVRAIGRSVLYAGGGTWPNRELLRGLNFRPQYVQKT